MFYLILLLLISSINCYVINKTKIDLVTDIYKIINTSENIEYNNFFYNNSKFINFYETIFCEYSYPNNIIKDYAFILNCTIQNYLTNGELKQITWTIPLIYLFFIPVLVFCFSYIMKCKCKNSLERKDTHNIIYRDGILP